MGGAGVRDLLGMDGPTTAEGRARVAVRADDRHKNPFGAVHGGVIATLVDIAMSPAVQSMSRDDETPVTIEMKVNYLEPGHRGMLVAVADYNAGSITTETFLQELLKFKNALTEPDARAVSKGLTAEQLAIFDLLMRPAPDLPEDEKSSVKRVAEELLTVLRREKLVLDWHKEPNTRAAVRVAVEETLDRLSEKFTRPIYIQKCNAVYERVFDSYSDDGRSVDDLAA
jgi:uncharacterized protein (TIGR00369 family)